MSLTSRVQYAAFGPLENVKPDPGTFDRIAKKFTELDLEVTSFSVMGFDINRNGPTVENVPKAYTTDGLWNFVIMKDRVDINYTHNPDNGISEFSDICTKANDYLKRMMELFCRQASRYAINGQSVYAVNQEPQIDSFFSEITKPLGSVPPSELIECILRTNRKRVFQINSKDESVNSIVDVSLGRSVDDPSRRAIILGYDINTFPTNTLQRFSPNDADEFHTQATSELSEFLRGFGEKINAAG